MAEIRVSQDTVLLLDSDETDILKRVLNFYILSINAEKSRELGRDLTADEKFTANPAFARLLFVLGIDDSNWKPMGLI